MSKHDTWIEISNPFYLEITSLFREGMLPARDPMPMCFYENCLCLFLLDNERIDDGHFKAIVKFLADKSNRSEESVLTDFNRFGSFAVHVESVKSVNVGVEGFVRMLEWSAFSYVNDPDDPQFPEKVFEFLKAHKDKWVNGETKPDLKAAWANFPEELKDRELGTIYTHLTANQVLSKGGYSVFDALTGKAAVDVLNEVYPDANYSLVSDDDEDDNDEEYLRT